MADQRDITLIPVASPPGPAGTPSLITAVEYDATPANIVLSSLSDFVRTSIAVDVTLVGLPVADAPPVPLATLLPVTPPARVLNDPVVCREYSATPSEIILFPAPLTISVPQADIVLGPIIPFVVEAPYIPPAGPPTYGILKIWTGVAWIAKCLKVYLGGSWQQKPLKRWDGSGWLEVNADG